MQRHDPGHADGAGVLVAPSADEPIWYVLIKNQQFGPLDIDHLAQLAREGVVTPDTLVWQPGFDTWLMAEKVSELFPQPPAELPADIVITPQDRPVPPIVEAAPADPIVDDNVADNNVTGDSVAPVDSPLPPPPPVKPKRRSPNYFTRHWRGEISLPVSYWINGFVGNVFAYLAVTAIIAASDVRENYDPTLGFVAVVGAWSAAFVVLLWQTVGIWRSASAYQKTKSFWGAAAKFVLVVGVLRTIGEFSLYGFPRIQDAYEILAGDERVGQHSFRVLRDGQELEFSGGITFGTAKEFEQFLDAMAGLRLVHLRSLGGRISEAQRIGDLIRKHNLDTYVPYECMSACTIIFLSGHERLITAKSRIGFHQPDLAGVTPEEREDLIAEEESRLRSLGLSAAFARKANLAPPDKMWFPSSAELITEKAATRVVDSADFALSGFAAADLTEDKIEKFLLASDIYAAIRKAAPTTYKKILERFVEGMQRGRSIAELRAEISPSVRDVFIDLLPYASDDDLVTFAKALVANLTMLNDRSPRDCYFYLHPEQLEAAAASAMADQYKELFAADAKLETQILSNFAGRTQPIPTETVVALSRVQIAAALHARFGNDADLLASDSVAPDKFHSYCEVYKALYAEVLKLPPQRAAPFLRYVIASR
jgi:hypothetical protein